MSRPDVTVVIPSIGRASLRTAIRSARHQEDVEVEVIVADDSADGRAESIGQEHGLTVLRSGGRGQSAARNAAIAVARAPWVAFLDDDDAWCPHHLASALSRARETGAECIVAPTAVVEQRGGAFRRLRGFGWQPHASRLLVTNLAPPSAVVTHTAKASGLFEGWSSPQDDWQAWLTLSARGVKFDITSKVTSSYRKDVVSRAYTVAATHSEKSLQAFASNYKVICRHWPSNIPEVVYGRALLRDSYRGWTSALQAGLRLPTDYYEQLLETLWGPPSSPDCCDPIATLGGSPR